MNKTIDIMYTNIKERLDLDKKKKDDSVIISFLNMTSNKCADYLRDTGLEREAFGSYIEDLMEDGYIASSGIDDKFCLTAKAIWEKEKDYLLCNDLILKYLNQKKFPVDSCKITLSPRNKVVVLLLLVCRNIDNQYCLDLKTDDVTLNKLEELMRELYILLKNLKITCTLKEEDLFGNTGNEHKVYNVLRHTDGINKTGIPFKAPGGQRYFLDIANNGVVDKSRLKTTLKRTLERDQLLKYDETNRLRLELTKLTQEYARYTNSDKFNPYMNTQFDSILQQALDYLYD